MNRFDHLKVLPFTLDKAERTTEAGRPRLDIKGWASTEKRDSDAEVIEVGFFDESLAEFMRRPLMPWMHDIKDLQGKWTSIEPLPGEGYYVRGTLIDFGTDLDKRRLGQVEEGLITSLSVGFRAQRSPACGAFDATTKTWHWQRNGQLREVSIVPLPANPDADMEVAKGLGWELAVEADPATDPDPDTDALPTEDEAKQAAEEARMVEDLQRATGGTRGVLNIVTHWHKAGRLLTPANRDQLRDLQKDLAAILEPYPAAGEPDPLGDAGADPTGDPSGRVWQRQERRSWARG